MKPASAGIGDAAGYSDKRSARHHLGTNSEIFPRDSRRLEWIDSGGASPETLSSFG